MSNFFQKAEHAVGNLIHKETSMADPVTTIENDPAVKNVEADGKAALKSALDYVKAAIDSTLAGEQATFPKQEGDVIAAANDVVESLLPPAVKPFIVGVIGLAGPAEGQISTVLATTVVSGLLLAKANIDAALNHLGA